MLLVISNIRLSNTSLFILSTLELQTSNSSSLAMAACSGGGNGIICQQQEGLAGITPQSALSNGRVRYHKQGTVSI